MLKNYRRRDDKLIVGFSITNKTNNVSVKNDIVECVFAFHEGDYNRAD